MWTIVSWFSSSFLSSRRLRDKGEDDKMPPLRKKQRGLILKLQQEQVTVMWNYEIICKIDLQISICDWNIHHWLKNSNINSHVYSTEIKAKTLIFCLSHRQRLSDYRRPIKQRGEKGSCSSNSRRRLREWDTQPSNSKSGLRVLRTQSWSVSFFFYSSELRQQCTFLWPFFFF